MLTMSHSCSSSDRGSWKESYRPPTVGDGGGETVTDLVESSEDSVDSDNSSTSSSLTGSRLQSSNLQPPIGCITTHCVSAAIRPERKMPPIDPLQFVKIQKNELCKKAVEQIKLAEKVKITKEKIKETEEEWQNNLMSWKSKRKLTKSSSEDESLVPITNRKTKTFSEILSEKARSGARIGYNLHHYLGNEDDDDDDLATAAFNASHNAQMMENLQNEDGVNINNGQQQYYYTSDESEENVTTAQAQDISSMMMESAQQEQQYCAYSNENESVSIDTNESNLNRLLKSKLDDSNCADNNNGNRENNGDQFCRNGLGEVVVFDTTLLKEFATKPDSNCDTATFNKNNSSSNNNRNAIVDDDQGSLNTACGKHNNLPHQSTVIVYESSNKSTAGPAQSQLQSATAVNEPKSSVYCQNSVDKNSPLIVRQSPNNSQKVFVPINEWKSSHSSNSKPQNARQQSLSISSDDDFNHQNSSFDAEDEEDEIDEELERLRIDQERSFKAKLYAFESLAKQEEEAARKATEACRMRQQSRAKLAAERSKSLGNIQQSSTQAKKHVTTSYSNSSSSLQNNESSRKNESTADQSKSLQNLNNSSDFQPATSSNTIIYNFTENAKLSPVSKEIKEKNIPQTRQELELKKETQLITASQPQELNPVTTAPIDKHELVSQNQSHMNIYENITPHSLSQQQQLTSVPAVQPELSSGYSSNDSNAIRNASQKLLQQQQQIYQNQPLPGHFQVQPYPQNEPYSNIQSVNSNNYGNYTTQNSIDHPVQPTDSILSDKVVNPVPIRNYSIADDVGLPPIQITKTTQSVPTLYSKTSQPPPQSSKSVPTLVNNEEEHLYVNQNQLMINTTVANPNTQIPIYDYHQANFDSYNNQIINEYYQEPNYENKAILLQQRLEEVAVGNGAYPSDQQQYSSSPNNAYQNQQQQQYNLFYPKPYSSANGTVKPVPKQSQQQLVQSNNATRVSVPAATADSHSHNTRYASGVPNTGHHVAYNQNHWLLQEAELRRQLDSIESNSQRSKNSNGIQHVQHHSKNGGYLSVSGKKKCSSCGDELGKGCAAMVVESLSLYYHINCFRCSVCNVQLGNGTVGTDVRVRNNKLHCQNCYSNDEAGLKFSRV